MRADAVNLGRFCRLICVLAAPSVGLVSPAGHWWRRRRARTQCACAREPRPAHLRLRRSNKRGALACVSLASRGFQLLSAVRADQSTLACRPRGALKPAGDAQPFTRAAGAILFQRAELTCELGALSSFIKLSGALPARRIHARTLAGLRARNSLSKSLKQSERERLPCLGCSGAAAADGDGGCAARAGCCGCG